MLGKTLIATYFTLAVVLAEHSPVIIWGSNSALTPAVHSVGEKEFEQIIVSLLADHMVVAFEEPALSSGDFNCVNGEKESSCYPYLRGVPMTYYPSVVNPNKALRAVAHKREHNVVDSNGELTQPLSCTPGKVVFVNFEKSEEEHNAVLQAHDAAIEAISHKISCRTVYMYYAEPSTTVAKHKRVRRAAAPSATSLSYKNVFSIYFTELYWLEPEKNKEEITISGMTVNGNSTTFNVTLAAANNQALTFTMSLLTDGYYQMSNLQFNGMQFRTNEVNAPTSFSYACGNLTLPSIPPNFDSAPAGTLYWNSLQLQAPFDSKYPEGFAFGDPWFCVGFFSPAILMGLLVLIILLAIAFTGIAWMLDLNTMDRFDDPKGKTISINANE